MLSYLAAGVAERKKGNEKEIENEESASAAVPQNQPAAAAAAGAVSELTMQQGGAAGGEGKSSRTLLPSSFSPLQPGGKPSGLLDQDAQGTFPGESAHSLFVSS